MADRHVKPVDDGWTVEKDNARRPSARAGSRAEAITRAEEIIAKNGGGTLVVHGSDGAVQERRAIAAGDRTATTPKVATDAPAKTTKTTKSAKTGSTRNGAPRSATPKTATPKPATSRTGTAGTGTATPKATSADAAKAAPEPPRAATAKADSTAADATAAATTPAAPKTGAPAAAASKPESAKAEAPKTAAPKTAAAKTAAAKTAAAKTAAAKTTAPKSETSKSETSKAEASKPAASKPAAEKTPAGKAEAPKAPAAATAEKPKAVAAEKTDSPASGTAAKSGTSEAPPETWTRTVRPPTVTDITDAPARAGRAAAAAARSAGEHLAGTTSRLRGVADDVTAAASRPAATVSAIRDRTAASILTNAEEAARLSRGVENELEDTGTRVARMLYERGEAAAVQLDEFIAIMYRPFNPIRFGTRVAAGIVSSTLGFTGAVVASADTLYRRSANRLSSN